MIDRKMNQMGFVNNGLGHIGGQPHPATKSSCDRRRSVVGCEDSSKSQPDLGERLFQFVFGKTESTPLGLKRFDRDRFPEQYPAPLDEFADPVETDTEEMAVFRSLLARTQLEHRELRLVYDAEKDGWSATAFHEKVNRQGASVVLMKTVGGAICGGYNPKGGKSMSVLDDPDTGPKFGADGLIVMMLSPFQTKPDGLEKIASSKLGTFYEVRPDKVRHVFSSKDDRRGTELLWLRTYSGVYAEGEEIPFNDALPVSLE